MSRLQQAESRLRYDREIREQARREQMFKVQEETEDCLVQIENMLHDLEDDRGRRFLSSEIGVISDEIQGIRHYMGDMVANEVFKNEIELHSAIAIIQQRRQVLEQQVESFRQEEIYLQGISSLEQRTRNLAANQLSILRRRIKEEQLDATVIKHLIQEIKHEMEQKIQEDRRKRIEEVELKTLEKQKEKVLQDIQDMSLSTVEAEQLRQRISQATREEWLQISQEVVQMRTQVLEDEAVRMEMVKAICLSLKEAGFVVARPIKQRDGEKDVVLVQAKRPQGNQAKFRVALNGFVTYKFDHYRGQQCKDDMEKVLPRLSEVYGVNLSDVRVIWENPDDRYATAKSIKADLVRSKG